MLGKARMTMVYIILYCRAIGAIFFCSSTGPVAKYGEKSGCASCPPLKCRSRCPGIQHRYRRYSPGRTPALEAFVSYPEVDRWTQCRRRRVALELPAALALPSAGCSRSTRCHIPPGSAGRPGWEKQGSEGESATAKRAVFV